MVSKLALAVLVSIEVFVLMSVTVVNGFVLDDPCLIRPRYPGMGLPKELDFQTTVEAPRDCTKGTFWWSYPRGHAMVHFRNIGRVDTKICFGEELGGEIFTIVDLTDGVNSTLPRVNRDDKEHTVCTPVTDSPHIRLRIDAPRTWYYMGAMSYVVVH